MIIKKEMILKMASMDYCLLPCVSVQENDKEIVQTAIQYEFHKNGEFFAKYFNPLAKEYEQVCKLDHVIDGKRVKGSELFAEFKECVQEKPVLDNIAKTDKINKSN